MNVQTLDLNADLGEWELENQSFEESTDSPLIPFLSSCNLSCGAHAGSPTSILQSLTWAQQNQLKIGAHPSYPDRENFGRKSLNLSPKELATSLHNQLDFFEGLLKKTNTELHHIKAHGALYNDLMQDETKANLFLQLLKRRGFQGIVYGLPNSVFEKRCLKAGFHFWAEGFLDRNYEDSGQLTPRSHPAACLHKPAEIQERLLRFQKDSHFTSRKGKPLHMPIQTLCLHGDHPQATAFAKSFKAWQKALCQ